MTDSLTKLFCAVAVALHFSPAAHAEIAYDDRILYEESGQVTVILSVINYYHAAFGYTGRGISVAGSLPDGVELGATTGYVSIAADAAKAKATAVFGEGFTDAPTYQVAGDDAGAAGKLLLAELGATTGDVSIAVDAAKAKATAVFGEGFTDAPTYQVAGDDAGAAGKLLLAELGATTGYVSIAADAAKAKATAAFGEGFTDAPTYQVAGDDAGAAGKLLLAELGATTGYVSIAAD